MNFRSTVAVTLLVPIVAFAAAARSRPLHPARGAHGPNGTPRRLAYTVAPVTRPGQIQGRVTWRGALPSATSLPAGVVGGFGCERAEFFSRIDVDAASHGVRHAVVYLADIARGAAPSGEGLTIDNVHCNFVPHVAATAVGAPVRFRNSDPGVLHNVRVGLGLLGDENAFNLGLPSGMSIARSVDREGIHRVICDIHPPMAGYLHTFDHPYFAVTSADGRFTIANVPPGSYGLHAWHEGWQSQGVALGRPAWSAPVETETRVTIRASGRAIVNFAVEPRGTITVGG